MKKDTERLESAERPRLDAGENEGVRLDFWDDFDNTEESKRIKRNERRARARKWGRAMRIPATLLLCTAAIILCIIFLVPRDVQTDSTMPDLTGETDTEAAIDTTESHKSADSETKAQTTEIVSASESAETESSAASESDTEASLSVSGDIYDFDYSAVPSGSQAILPADLSLIAFGENYINNSTGYTPNIKELLYAELGGDALESLLASSQESAPLVLILHTHGTEAYVEHGATYHTDDGSEFARSHNAKENVVAVGSVLADVLNRAGIPTLHSTVLHDSVQYKDSYVRSAETVKKYLETYPSIKLVIDLHRDSVINSNGDIIKPITLADGERCAQIKFTVGSSWSGDRYDSWEKNLSLALKLRRELNAVYTNICRPVSLESTTYNQELAPYSLLVEIGASGNSLEEAMCAANALGKILAPLVKNI